MHKSEKFFKSVQSLYRKYGLDLTLKVVNPIFSATNGEFLPRESVILIRPTNNSINYDTNLIHETAHALEHIYGKIGKLDTHFYGGGSTGMGMFLKSANPIIKKEISLLLSSNQKDTSFQIYSNDTSELFASFVTKMLMHPQSTERIAPNAFKIFKQKFVELRNIN